MTMKHRPKAFNKATTKDPQTQEVTQYIERIWEVISGETAPRVVADALLNVLAQLIADYANPEKRVTIAHDYSEALKEIVRAHAYWRETGEIPEDVKPEFEGKIH
jgi:hypothetical protein